MFSADWFPLHTDAEYAKKTMFKDRIAHGLLVLSVASGLIPPSPQHTIAFYGMDNVRFIRPTHIGDTIHAEGEVLDVEERNDVSGIVAYRQIVKNQNDEDVAVGSMKVLMAREKKKK
jgi:acyl dehydratase